MGVVEDALAKQTRLLDDKIRSLGLEVVSLEKQRDQARQDLGDVLAQVEEIQRLDNVLKTKVGIDFEINVAYEILKNFGLRSGFCACCGVPAGTKCDDSCVWS